MATDIIGAIFSVGTWLKDKFGAYKGNQEEAKRLFQRIEALEQPLTKIKELETSKFKVSTLQNVLNTMKSIKDLVESFPKKSKFVKFFKSSKYMDQFKQFDNRLDSYIGDLNVELTLLTNSDVRDLANSFAQISNWQKESDMKTEIYLDKLSRQIEQLQVNQQPTNSTPQVFIYENSNLGFIKQKFGLESESGLIICRTFNLQPQEPTNFDRFMKGILEFSTGLLTNKITILYNSWDLDGNKVLDRDELIKAIHDLYFLITCLQFKKLVGPLEEHLIKLKEEDRKNFYTTIEELVAKNEINSQVDQLLDSLETDVNEVNFSEFQTYCKQPGNFVIQFLNLMSSLLNETLGDLIFKKNEKQVEEVTESPRTSQQRIETAKLKKLLEIKKGFENKLRPNQVLEDPVLVCGKNFERKDMMEILSKHPDNPRIPLTGDLIDREKMQPLSDLKSQIEEWKKKRIKQCIKNAEEIKNSNPNLCYELLEFAHMLDKNELDTIDLQITLLQNQLRIPEEIAKKQFQKAEIFFEKKDYTKVESLLSSAMENTTNNDLMEKILFLLKEIYILFNKKAEEIQTHISLARIYLQQNPQKAKEILVQLDSRYAESSLTQEVYSLLISADESLRNHKETAIWYYKGGSLYFTKRNHTKAIKYLAKAFEIDNTYVEALEKLAVVYNSLKEKDNESLTYCKIGQVYFRKYDNNKAIEAYKNALLCDKSNNLAFTSLFNLIQDKNSVSDLIDLVSEYKIQSEDTKDFLIKISQKLRTQSNDQQLELYKNQISAKDQEILSLTSRNADLKKKVEKNEQLIHSLKEIPMIKKLMNN
ncbi:mixed lineage kinase domain-like protein [Anaeramoeba ignava]|uniref:Mixed lineage kinase domain-like protein n=1 Tax=Anaeramoeba ignava TaxID=1746090 RepID=A0A9Q0LBP4_ANAIG|nr:mixed lineage kinase domain-like protein [Anaeramoeba ignava]